MKKIDNYKLELTSKEMYLISCLIDTYIENNELRKYQPLANKLLYNNYYKVAVELEQKISEMPF